MSVFVCGLNPRGNAYKDGGVHVGDEVLEVNGTVVSGRCHLNASSVFKALPGPDVRLVVLRRTQGVHDMAVKPLTHFPVSLEDERPEEKFARFKGLANVVVKKGSAGVGIMIIEGKHAEYGEGIFISDLQEASPAAQAGLQVGDMILMVNKQELVGADYETATAVLRRAEGLIDMWVANGARCRDELPVSGGTPAPPSAPRTPAKKEKPVIMKPPPNPATAPIKPGEETTIEIPKEKMGLGLSIVGGSDTLLGAILIHEVYPDGAAAQDGRLRPGDQILEVSGQNFRAITHQRALSVLRQTPAKVQMVVYREEGAGGAREEELYEVISVHLTKKQGKGLGLSIVGRKNGPGVFISDLVEGGVAAGDGRLMQGDQILEVNETDVRQATQEQAAAVLKCAPSNVHIRLGRLRPARRGPKDASWPVMVDQPHTPASLPAQQLPLVSPQHPPGVKEIVLERGDDGLGFSIVGGFGSNLGDLPIYVKSVFERGSAAREGTLRRGDQLLMVNGTSLRGTSHASAVTILKEAKGAVTMLILPAK
ncbi:LOW QUALITY PROTEIN: multiple PDZ domain protein-like [Hyalella azteca]|uniref:LOW QUALITY PROTEIN: multiple PDZ domain protein-like n=1 Tax=Hyalella azteca TaxID=294128 RepID=A0A979FQ82_HYAAZ|nr:LOW QUALITY PROTEIN: multiple PDZ domain protein-like [Hyalella azteca]